MRYFTLARLFMASLLAAVIISIIGYFGLRLLNENSTFPHRQEFAQNLATQMEQKPYAQTLEEFGLRHRGPNGEVHGQLWVIDDKGNLLGSSGTAPLPFPENEFPKPEGVHDMAVKYEHFSLIPEYTIIRLQAPTPTFLISRMGGSHRGPFGQQPIWLQQIGLTFILVLASVFLALSLTFLYLNGKSKEAKAILSSLERGDLKARFTIQRFDQIGNLMLDFNRMASEIERLVESLQNSEHARRGLLQELGHDLRTPLTSLSTSIGTLATHADRISVADRNELLSVAQTELEYFVQLIDDLFFIAELESPKLSSQVEVVDLAYLLESEIKMRNSIEANQIKWDLHLHTPSIINGSGHLLRRLIKNLLDNAGRFATRQVLVRLTPDDGFLELCVEDDGTGMSDDEIAAYGVRRSQRSLSQINTTKHASLGLGSVIVKSIVEMHHGTISIANLKSQGRQGTQIKVRFHRAVHAKNSAAAR